MQTTIEKRDERLHMVVTPEDIKLLERLCQKAGMNKSEFIRHLIRNYLDSIDLRDLLNQSQKMNNDLIKTVSRLTRSVGIHDRLVHIFTNMVPANKKLGKNADEIKALYKELISLE